MSNAHYDLIESLFSNRTAVDRHIQSPLFNQRAEYLQHLVTRGMHRRTIKDTAALLNHAIRLLKVSEQERVSDSSIREAAAKWSKEVLLHRPTPLKSSAERFYTAANGFLLFHNLKAKSEPLSCCFDSIYFQFYDSLLAKGYLPTTVKAIGPPVRTFLFWLSTRQPDLCLVSWNEIQEYLGQGISSGWQPRTVAGRCQALRNLFRFTESKGWSRTGLDLSISNPVIRSRDRAISGPPWVDVRRIIRMTGDSTAQESRARAVILLCSVYGLRSSEIRRLTVDAFDWKSESFTLRRAKNGYWQRLPISHELGEALIKYLREYRPAVPCGTLFVSLRFPYGPLQNLGSIIKKRMRIANLEGESFGPHSLRHSCATELLRQGTSLQNIANLLGHRDLRSVGVYARHDLNSLRAVADFSLAGIA